MRTLCDACESAAAIVFCAADEAALCRSCDEKVHLCNKLASRHVRVGLAAPSELTRCDICENSSAFFYCDIDGTSLCLQCDLSVHVGGKRTHERYLLFRQRVEFPGDKEPLSQSTDQPPKLIIGESQQNHRFPPVPAGLDASADGHAVMDTQMFDLNLKPQRVYGQDTNNQDL